MIIHVKSHWFGPWCLQRCGHLAKFPQQPISRIPAINTIQAKRQKTERHSLNSIHIQIHPTVKKILFGMQNRMRKTTLYFQDSGNGDCVNVA